MATDRNNFHELAFDGRRPAEAVKQFVGGRYMQHNAQAPDGTDAFVEFVNGFAARAPDLSIVVTHGLIKTSADDAGTVAADLWRLEHGMIVEHWDVLQPFPETSVNDDPMF